MSPQFVSTLPSPSSAPPLGSSPVFAAAQPAASKQQNVTFAPNTAPQKTDQEATNDAQPKAAALKDKRGVGAPAATMGLVPHSQQQPQPPPQPSVPKKVAAPAPAAPAPAPAASAFRKDSRSGGASSSAAAAAAAPAAAGGGAQVSAPRSEKRREGEEEAAAAKKETAQQRQPAFTPAPAPAQQQQQQPPPPPKPQQIKRPSSSFLQKHSEGMSRLEDFSSRRLRQHTELVELDVVLTQLENLATSFLLGVRFGHCLGSDIKYDGYQDYLTVMTEVASVVISDEDEQQAKLMRNEGEEGERGYVQHFEGPEGPFGMAVDDADDDDDDDDDDADNDDDRQKMAVEGDANAV